MQTKATPTAPIAAPRRTKSSKKTTSSDVVSKKPSNSTKKSENGARPPRLKSCLSSVSNASSGLKKTVSFHEVEIREYERIVGDNPAVTAGNAVSMAWNHHSQSSISFSEYESSRPPRRCAQQFQMPAKVRHDLLVKGGATEEEMNQAHYQIKRTQLSRRASIANQEFEGAFIVMESIGRKWKRTVSKKKKTDTQQQEENGFKISKNRGKNKKNGTKSKKSDKKQVNRRASKSDQLECSREYTVETEETEETC